MPHDSGRQHARGPADGNERRGHPRFPYPAVARFAPLPDGNVPAPLLMRDVLCRDISHDGVSFYSDQHLSCDMGLIQLPIGEPPLRMLIRIVHQLPAALLTLFDEDARHPNEFVVGCEFISRFSS